MMTKPLVMDLLENRRGESHFPFSYVCEAEVCPGTVAGRFLYSRWTTVPTCVTTSCSLRRGLAPVSQGFILSGNYHWLLGQIIISYEHLI